MSDKIFIIGGAGYVGSALTEKLVQQGYNVTVYDLLIYGSDFLQKHKNLKIIQGDIRNYKKLENEITGHNICIHLACISNDPSFELNPLLGKKINLDSFEPLVQIAKKKGIKKFLYASSSSVYGIKKEKDVTEDLSLNPLTDYSKYKVQCEKILNTYGSNDFTVCTLRPATVCGFSKRQRFDVIVNILTNLAFHNRKIKIFGGKQLRPNIHIKDMVDAYICLINAKDSIINKKIYNVGSSNFTVEEIAQKVRKVVGDDVKYQYIKSIDNRSYHINSKKIFEELKFKTKFTIEDAVKDLKHAFEIKLFDNSLENEMYFNIKRMTNINLK
tara:strand:- start:3143 stop:4126 length:984 start_codon:yes stop_codon:yes gene_type:complete